VAYPFQPAITLREFLARVERLDVTVHTMDEPTIGSRGPVYYRYLVKGASFVVLPEIEDHDLLTPDVLRSLCDRLAIPKVEFSLTLE
jgi:hypothetical protein